jgi:hypothetical protein
MKRLSCTRQGLRPAIALCRVSTADCMAICAVIMCTTAWAVHPVAGAQVNYGTHSGANVNFLNVTEDTGSSEPLPLFGAPIVGGDSLDFNPTGFDASSSGGGSDITDVNLVMMITAKPGQSIESIVLSESGDTTLSGNVTPGSVATASAVFADGVLDIHEVNFAGINHISVPFSFTFNPSGGTYFLGTDGGGGPIFHTQWSGTVTLPVEQILIANGIPGGGATKVSIDLDNILVGVSQSDTTSAIDKKDFSMRVVVDAPDPTANVPEPTAIYLTMLGLLAVGGARRQRGWPRQRPRPSKVS